MTPTLHFRSLLALKHSPSTGYVYDHCDDPAATLRVEAIPSQLDADSLLLGYCSSGKSLAVESLAKRGPGPAGGLARVLAGFDGRLHDSMARITCCKEE